MTPTQQPLFPSPQMALPLPVPYDYACTCPPGKPDTHCKRLGCLQAQAERRGWSA